MTRGRAPVRRAPKPSKLLEDALDGPSGSPGSPRALFLGHRHGSRTSGRSAPRPIPGSTHLASAASAVLPLRPPSQRQLARMHSLPIASARRMEAASDDEHTAFHEHADDESGMLSAGSGMDGIDSPEALNPLSMSDDESDSEGEAGGRGGVERFSDAVSSQATSLFSRPSLDVTSAMQ